MPVPLLANRFKPAEYIRQSYFVTPRPEDGPETLLDPKYWVHVSKVLKAGDRIEVRAEDGSWKGELDVLDAGTWGAKVAWYVGPVKLSSDAAIEAPEDYDVKWGGPAVKFRVMRKSDNKVLKEGCQTKEEAATWIKSHRNAMAA